MIDAVRALHLLAFVTWLGPTTGGYLVLQSAIRARRSSRPLPREQELWLWQRFEVLLRVEHGAFLVLIASGVVLLHGYGMSVVSVGREGPAWLQAKLAIVLLVLVPVEIYDVVLSHVRLPRELARLAAGDEAPGAVLLAHERFLARGVWLFALLIPALLYLITYRP